MGYENSLESLMLTTFIVLYPYPDLLGKAQNFERTYKEVSSEPTDWNELVGL